MPENKKGISYRLQILGILMTMANLIFFPPVAQAETTGNLDHLAKELSSPEALVKFMKQNFTYVTDHQLFGQDEYWQSAEEMLERRRGDCEDYALFAEAILSRNEYQVFILSVYWDNDAHTVAVFEQDGRWGILNLDQLRYTKASSIAELSNTVRQNWSYAGLMRQEGKIGIISRKFKTEEAHKAPLSSLIPYFLALANRGSKTV